MAAASATPSTIMPEVVTISGCDDALWNNMPFGAQRDLERFCQLATNGEEFVPTKEFPISPLELAKNRVDTMKDINRFVDKKNKDDDEKNDDADDSVSSPFEELAWNNGVLSWELNNLAIAETAKAKVKADKKAKNKLLREATAAAKAKAEAEAEKLAAEADNNDADDADNAFQ